MTARPRPRDADLRPLFGTDSASFTRRSSRRMCSARTAARCWPRACRRRQRGPGLHDQLRLGQGHHHAGALTVTASGAGRQRTRSPSPSLGKARYASRCRRATAGSMTARLLLGDADLRPLFGTDSASFTQAFQSKDVLGPNGSTLLASAGRRQQGRDYTISFVSAKGTITPAPDGDGGGDSRVYDGTTFILGHADLRPAVRHGQRELYAGLPVEGCARPERQHAVWPRAVSPTATGAGITPSASSRPRAPSRRPR